MADPDRGAAIRALIDLALAEDAARDDVTTLATVPPDARGAARLVAKEPCVVAGLDAFATVFARLDPTVEVERSVEDGETVIVGETIARITGPLRPILTGERTALNIVQRLSGVATTTRRYVEAAGPSVAVRDTRKTTPGMRALEKAAVLAGGGVNHRSDLSAALLIKDNHVAAAGGIERGIRLARDAYPGRWLEVECDTLEQVREAVDAGADEVLLDNMSAPILADAVSIVAGRAKTEASGGITLETIAEVAATGVDAISVGALTHSAPSIDLSLEIEAG